MRKARLCSAAGLVALAALSAAHGEEASAACLEKVSPSVWVVLRGPESRYQLSNSAFIVTSQGAIAVDPPSDRETFDCALRSLREITGAEVKAVVLTHWHGDHTAGAGYFAAEPGAQGPNLIGSPEVAAKLPEAEKDHAERLGFYRKQLPRQEEILRTGVTPSGREITAEEREMLEGWIPSRRRWLENHEAVRFVPPKLTFEGELALHYEPEVRLLHLKGHTRGDVVVFVPRENVLISGDLVDRIPFAGHGSLTEWLASLERLRELGAERIVPGHGPLYRGPEQLDRLRTYFERAAELSRTAEPAPLEEPAEESDPATTRAAALAAAHGEELAALLLPDATPAELGTFSEMVGSVFEAALAEMPANTGG